MVDVRCQAGGDAWLCRVRLDRGGEQWQHEVTVTAADLERWARGSSQKDVEDLVSRSFEFLLRREPASSILRRFDLAVIQSYFPEYDREFKRQ